MSTSRAQEFLASIPIVTKCLLIFNVTVHAVIFLTSYPVYFLAINPILVIFRGEYYRLISSAFVHGGILHIAMNMSTLLAIGGSLENQYGSLYLILLTLWALILDGTLFIVLVWSYSVLTAQPNALNTSAVGYSGVLFTYALIEAFHSTEVSRSVFGLFSVPTKAYPFILLVLIQVLMPNISWWGHLSGLLVGVLLISRPGVDALVPTAGCLACIEASPCWRATAVGISGYVPLREKALVHPNLDYAGGACCGACWSSLRAGALQCVACVCQAFLLLWQVLAAALHIIGIPASVTSALEGWGGQACSCCSADCLWGPESHDNSDRSETSAWSMTAWLRGFSGYAQVPQHDDSTSGSSSDTAAPASTRSSDRADSGTVQYV